MSKLLGLLNSYPFPVISRRIHYFTRGHWRMRRQWCRYPFELNMLPSNIAHFFEPNLTSLTYFSPATIIYGWVGFWCLKHHGQHLLSTMSNTFGVVLDRCKYSGRSQLLTLWWWTLSPLVIDWNYSYEKPSLFCRVFRLQKDVCV